MKQFFAASSAEIEAGETTDTYFVLTRKVLESNGMDRVRVKAEVTASELPDQWPWAVFSGVEEVIRLFEGMPVTVRAMREGTLFRNKSRKGIPVPVLTVEGEYYRFCLFETPALGFLCQSSGITTMSARYRQAAGDKTLLFFGVRRAHPAIAPMIDRASYMGGCDAVSSIIGARTIGHAPQGTMPHAEILVFGDSRKAFDAYSRGAPKGTKKIALVDTFSDEKNEALLAAETIPDLYAVRLDTPKSRRGSFPSIVSEVRWELDSNGHRNVRIIVSGGLNEGDIPSLVSAGADGFGVGTAISNAPTVDFALDIVEVGDRKYTKRGKFSGAKRVFRCPRCLQFDVIHQDEEAGRCPSCGIAQEEMLHVVLDGGKRTAKEESVDSMRERVLSELKAAK